MTTTALSFTELREVREAAQARFEALGFPSTKNEDWKYTNLAPFVKKPWERAAAVRLAEIDHPLADLECPRLVFVSGRYEPRLSTPPSGVRAGSMRDALPAGVARYADFSRNAMVALNTAQFEDGAFVEIAAGAALDAPVHILYISTGGGVSYPRTWIVAGRESQASIIESYLGLGDAAGFTAAVTELVAGDGAVIEHVKLQAESAGALHWGMLRVEQGAASNVASHNVAFGAALARTEIVAVLAGEGAECVLNGLYLTHGAQHIDTHTTLDHAKPHTTSRELYKGVLDGRSQGVFHGRIVVRPEAQKTDAIQRNRNLLLSREALVNTKPQLEIYADDVRCTHGATVGQVDEDAVFYLRSRGIPLDEARSLLVRAFSSEILDSIRMESLRMRLAAAVAARLTGGGVV
jgi:Fe-S cluster assembly protein SufD